MMNLQQQFLLCLAVLTVFSCTTDKEWENPFDPESGTEFTAPEITSITATDFDKLVISWSAGDSAYTMIRLERSESASFTSFEQVAEVPVSPNSYSDSGLEFGSTYYYRLLGMADEVEGEYSEIASAQLNLPAPTDLTAEALSDHEIELTWNYALLAKVSRYWISASGAERHNEKRENRQPEKVKSAVEKSGGESTLPAGKGTPQVADRLEKKIDPLAPQREEVVTLPHDRGILLERTWGQRGFEDGFIIERAEGSGEFAVIDTLDAGDTEYEDNNLLYGPTYKYRVCAYADQYKSDYSDEVSTTTTFPAPSDLTATVTGDQSIALSWSDNCSFEDGFELWRKAGSGSFEIIDSTVANGTAYADLGLTYGESYSYKVRAYTNLNVSEYSNADALELAIPKPTALTVLQGDNTAILSWTDNSSFETGFSIEKSVEAAPFAEIGTVASDVTTYTDTDIDAISQYRYRVRAFTDSNYSDYSDEADFSMFTGDIYYISPTGSDFTGNGSANYPYKTIQKGIDVAGDSSLILVAEGTYNESIDFSDKELTVASYYWLDIDTSHISATTISAVEGRAVNIDADGSELLGLTVISGEDEQGSGIYASNQVTIANCIITGNSYTGTGTGAGIYCAFYSEVTISNCTITGYSITGNQSRGAGVYCGSYSTVNFTDCTITGNVITGDESHGAGIYASASSELSLSNCTVTENAIVGESAAGAGVYSVGAALEVTDCDISGNTVTAENPGGSAPEMQYSVMLYDSYGDGWNGCSIDVLVNGTVIIDNLTFNSGSSAGPYYFTVINEDIIATTFSAGSYVNETSYQIFNENGTYVASASNGGTIIYLVPGIYNPGTQGVGICSSADLTIDNSTINNNEIIIPGRSEGPYGGGVFATGSLTMTDSETSNNGADGVYCTSSGASYTDITASGNGSYGIYSGGNASFTNITANTNGASGLYDEDGTSIFDNCTANSNTGDGIYTAGDGTFSNCTANNNGSGRGIWCDGAGSFTTCETDNNFSDGIYAAAGSDFTGCDAGGNGGDGLYAGGNSTFFGCTATGNGGGGMWATGTGDFFGCTSGSNGSAGIIAGTGSSTVDGCDVTNNSDAGVMIAGNGDFSGLTILGNNGTGLSAGNGGSTFTDCELGNNAGSGISVGQGTSYFTDITISNSSAGRGIYNGGTGEFVNVTVLGSSSDGIYVEGSGTSYFTDIQVTNSSAGRGIYNGGTGEFVNVTVSGSSSDGIYTGASTSLNNCSSSDNGGYGIWVESAGFLTNCAADGNSTGIYVGAYSSEIINSLATNNSTYGIELMNSSTLIQNCTVSDNGTGVFAAGTSGPAFMNVILYDNTTELDGESGSTYTIDYSDVKGGATFGAWATGSGNIDADPLFAGVSDYELQDGSPCIDTGNPGVQYNDADGSRNDMGAYGGPNGDW